tara:strand:- start:1033 stop:1173 length:141 start_codon:yes stop_codon:yes gene_type:complete
MELKDKIKEVLKEDVPKLFTIVRWDGMFDGTVDKIVKVIKENNERH